MLIFAFFDTRFGQDPTGRWSALRQARPASRQHFPLNLPSSLGDYDLRDPAQAVPVVAMARQAGIDGFVIDCVWRDGAYRHDGTLLAPHCREDFGLALRWRNGDEPLWGDASDPMAMEARAAALIAGLRDLPARTLGGGIVVIVDRPKQLAAPAAVVALLRRAAVEAGLPGLYLIANRAEDKGRFLASGFDALIDPPPDEWQSCPPTNRTTGLDFLEVMAGLKDSADYLDRYFSYLSFTVSRTLQRDRRGKAHPLVFPAFHDWYAHPDGGATHLVNHGHRPADPHLFGLFVENSMLFAQGHFAQDRRAIFLHSWNGWFDGSQVEPSLLDGDLIYNALRDAVDRGRYMIRSRGDAQPVTDPLLRANIDRVCAAIRAESAPSGG